MRGCRSSGSPRASSVPRLEIRSEADYEAALAEVGRLMETSTTGTADDDRLEVLVLLVQDYEARHHASPPPNALDAIRFRLEQQGLTRKALEGVIGSRARVSEVLGGKRRLSLEMMRRLHERFGIPAESLLTAG